VLSVSIRTDLVQIEIRVNLLPLDCRFTASFNPAFNLPPPSLGGPVWPQAIERSEASDVEIIFFRFEHRCAALHSDRLPAAQDSPAAHGRFSNPSILKILSNNSFSRPLRSRRQAAKGRGFLARSTGCGMISSIIQYQCESVCISG
jgi:hypothetical protein